MKHSTIFKSLFISLFMIAMTSTSYASLICKTSHGEKEFKIDNQHISFISHTAGRTISSNHDSMSRKTHNGFKKLMYIDGKRILININQVNPTDNFMSIRNEKGHKVTYSINCTNS